MFRAFLCSYIRIVINSNGNGDPPIRVNFFLMVLPTSFSPSRQGYNKYLKALGINPNDQQTRLMFAIPFEQFKSIDRRTIDDKIQEAGREAERLHDEYVLATKEGRETDAKMALSGWDRRAKEFQSLVRQKHTTQIG